MSRQVVGGRSQILAPEGHHQFGGATPPRAADTATSCASFATAGHVGGYRLTSCFGRMRPGVQGWSAEGTSVTVLHWLGHNWHDLAEGVNNVVQAAGIIAAGTFGYLRFVRGRVLHSSLALELKAEPTTIDGSKALLVVCEVKNAGSIRQILDFDCLGNLEVMWAKDSLWASPQSRNDFYWPDAPCCRVNVLADDDGARRRHVLEPGEVLDTSSVVPIPAGNWVADGGPSFLWQATLHTRCGSPLTRRESTLLEPKR